MGVGCCQPSFLSVYLGTYKETAPAVNTQLKTTKLLFIHENTHKTASLRLAGLFTTLIRDSKDFGQPGRPKGRWVSLWTPWSRYPVWPSCLPPPPLLAARTQLDLCWLPTSLSCFFSFPHWFFSPFCEVLTIPVSTIVSACNFTPFSYYFSYRLSHSFFL